jgi:hypothetical protein
MPVYAAEIEVKIAERDCFQHAMPVRIEAAGVGVM